MQLQLRSPLLAQTTLSSCVLFFLLISSPGPVTAAGELTGRGLSLRERPATRASYATAILSFLRVAGYGKYLTDLSGHGVSTVGADVKHCQSAKNVTPCSSPSLAATTPLPPPGTSPIDHLWSAFLGGGSRRGGVRRRPFGDAVLDGVDFYLDGEAEQERFSDLASRNNGGGNDGAANKAVRLTATPPCSRVLDNDMGGGELGLFQRLHVRFYEMRPGAGTTSYHETRPFWGAWHMWVSRFPAARLLVGLPATDGRDEGDDTPNYGGLMLWDRYYDKLTGLQ
ncbi:hypothetical protein SETIT_8G244500v2 [Setaria italica]|uniref:GH18 domain-containing protein n=1 Tax=Setaria italica TaxID=4555 RepID=A0A368SBI7_SETIT|nr:hypothetical protein SETIT_8G244500v2 [Setaria italica]